MNTSNLEYTCIFGGGAIRGIAYVGALKAFNELNLQINTLAGSSVGAIFAGLLAVGYSAEEIENIILKVKYDLFKDIQIGKSFGISKGNIFLEWIQELIERKFYGPDYEKGKNKPVRFCDLKKNLVIFTTNLANFCCKEFSTFKTPEAEVAYAIRISASMPGLMQPITASGAILVDGDLQKSWPLWKLSENLYNLKDRILEIRLEGDYDNEKQGNINFVNSIYSCVTSIATKLIVNDYAKKDKFDYLVINTGSTVVVDFNISEEKRLELIHAGYVQTKDYFDKFLKQKKKELLEYYLPLKNITDNVYKLIKNKKFLQAKNNLGEFYMNYIQEISKYIDKDFLTELNIIKDLILKNYSTSILFKKVSLKNSKLILHKLDKFNTELQNKILELQYYNVS